MRAVTLLAMLASGLLACRPNPAPRPAHRPVIDSHVHLTPSPDCIARALRIFAAAGIERFCVKSAGFAGSARFQATRQLQRRLGRRLAMFVNIDWRGFGRPGWQERELARLERAAAAGARGVKIFKNLGLGLRDADGRLVAVDDARLDPLMEKCAQLGLIVAIHTADPEAFFRAPGPANERYLELLFAPSWSFWGRDYPRREELLAARNRLVARHPRTTFLGIHLANNPEHLDQVAAWLERYPNLYVDTSARLPEIGRHPADQVRRFFIKYQERILFGSDLVVSPAGLQLGSLSIFPQDDDDAREFYRAHWRYFESRQRGLDTPTPIQGDWKIDGIGLPAEVLEKLYRGNALRLIWREGG